jgi:hypothetical protein
MSLDIEYHGFSILKSLLQGNGFEVSKSFEGARADMAVRPDTYSRLRHHNRWMAIQLKTTTKATDKACYKFHVRKDYTGMLMAFVCCADKRVWIMEASLLQGYDTIDIGWRASKYNKYEVFPHTIQSRLMMYYHGKGDIAMKSLHSVIMPTSPTQLKEQYFRRNRETRLGQWLNFSYSEREGLPWDFKIGGCTVQEKVATARNKDLFSVTLRRNNRKLYQKGDATYYWFHVPSNENVFFLFHENVLIRRGYIKKESKGACSIYLSTLNRKKWYSKSMYRYDDFIRSRVASTIPQALRGDQSGARDQ